MTGVPLGQVHAVTPAYPPRPCASANADQRRAPPRALSWRARWYRLVKAANWNSMDDIRRAAPKSKALNRERTRFEVAGGNYRLITAFDSAGKASICQEAATLCL